MKAAAPDVRQRCKHRPKCIASAPGYYSMDIFCTYMDIFCAYMDILSINMVLVRLYSSESALAM